MVASAVEGMAAAPTLPSNPNGCSGSLPVIAKTAMGPANLPSNPQGTNSSANSSDVGPTRTRTSENRRSNKPIMEKRRRARINNCLNELKTLILDAMKKDPARHSKLEKADILEMTVKHLETLQRQQVAMAAATDPNVANKFRAGFTECAGEVGRFPGLDGPVKRRLLQHLANCLNNAAPTPTQPASNPQTTTEQPAAAAPQSQPVQVHILRSPDANIIQGLQFVPTRLPNGDLALILPAARSTPVSSPSSPSPSVSSVSSGSSPLPMLIPIPNRTVANSPSPVAFDRLSVNPAPAPRQITILTTSSVPRPAAVKVQIPSPPIKEEHEDNERLVINEEYMPEHHRQYYGGDQETLLHIPEREYCEDSYEDTSESEYYGSHPSQCYSPEPAPLALVTRKRCEDEDQPWRPW